MNTEFNNFALTDFKRRQCASKYFKKETQERMKKAKSNNCKIYIGDLTSDDNIIEGLFCCDSFVIDDGKLIIDATEDAW